MRSVSATLVCMCPPPVLLDVASQKPDAVLLLDCWSYIVVHCSASTAARRAAGYLALLPGKP